jgi:hypothetical protein
MLSRLWVASFFGHLPVERFERVRELAEIRTQRRFCPQLELFGQSPVPGDLHSG